MHKILLIAGLIALAVSGIKPHDYFTWFLEVAPTLVGVAVMLLTYNRFPLTDLLYILIFIHSLILMIGGHWTYAEVPWFNYLRDIGIFARNNYDKVGHFAQGFVPFLIAREILLRTSPLKTGKWLNFLSVSVVLAISAFYELVEWWVSLLSGSSGDAFLGTQGYVWDTQSDMLWALLGALVSMAILSKLHNKQLSTLKEKI